MVDYQSPALDSALAALSDPTRRALLVRLAKKECTVSELAEPFEISLAAISKHLMVLEQASLVVKKREGRTFVCQINPGPFREISELVVFYEGFWNQRLDALEQFLAEPQSKGKKKRERKHHATTRSKTRRKARH